MPDPQDMSQRMVEVLAAIPDRAEVLIETWKFGQRHPDELRQRMSHERSSWYADCQRENERLYLECQTAFEAYDRHKHGDALHSRLIP